MSDSGEELASKQESAIVALLSSKNVEEAARVVDVDPRTIYRWLKEPAFNAAYREAKRASFSQGIARLQQMTSAAVSTIGRIMVDPNTPASTRLRAADSIISHAAKAIEIEDLETRLSLLEQAAEMNKNNRR